ncbi:MAG: hypothetical protein ACRC5T_04635 [Cetobacterium sp.]
MEKNFVITEEIIKKYGIKKEEVKQIWQWYGEEELESVLDYNYNKFTKKEKEKEEMTKDAFECLDNTFFSTDDEDVFIALDRCMRECLSHTFDKKWKVENFSFKCACDFLSQIEKENSIDLSYFKQKMAKEGIYTLSRYGEHNWSLEDIEECDVILDSDILHILLYDTSESDTKIEFEKKLSNVLHEEYHGEYSDSLEVTPVTKKSGMYCLAYTTSETGEEEYNLLYNYDTGKLIWEIDGKKVAEECYTKDELIENFNFDMLFEHCYDVKN